MESQEQVNRNSLGLFAKLLAAENITVIHTNVRTASFDTKSRILTLPNWQHLEKHTYNLLVGHEVGHAKFTDPNFYEILEAMAQDRGFKKMGRLKDIFNVVEDVRIERLIQILFPGLKTDFQEGSKVFFKEDFFGVKERVPNSLGFVDRVNLFFKMEHFYSISFETSEEPIVEDLRKMMTKEQAYDLTARIYELIDKQKEAKKDPDPVTIPDRREGNSDDQPEQESFEETEEEVQPQTTDAYPDDQDDENKDEESDKTGSGAGDPSNEEKDEEEPSTYKNFHENLANGAVQTTATVNYLSFHDDYRCFSGVYDVLHIQSNTKDLKEDGSRFKANESENLSLYQRFVNDQKDVIAYYVSEFQRQKAAVSYSQRSISKTGNLDPLRLHQYKFSEDIFRRNTKNKQGKNHGLVMFVDMSGSMYGKDGATLLQAAILSEFCQRVRIPFKVYTFGSFIPTFKESQGKLPADNHGKVTMRDTAHDPSPSGYRLTEVISSEMPTSMMRQIIGMMVYRHYNRYDVSANADRLGLSILGDTPLCETILRAIPIVKKFQETHAIEVMNTVFLTDGDASDGLCIEGKEYAFLNLKKDGKSYRDFNNNQIFIKGILSGRQYDFGRFVRNLYENHNWKSCQTAMRTANALFMLDYLKQETGSNVLDLYLYATESNTARGSMMDIARYEGQRFHFLFPESKRIDEAMVQLADQYFTEIPLLPSVKKVVINILTEPDAVPRRFKKYSGVGRIKTESLEDNLKKSKTKNTITRAFTDIERRRKSGRSLVNVIVGAIAKNL